MSNVLFLTLADIIDIKEHGIYSDLLREFVKNGHKVYIVSPTERRNNGKTELIDTELCKILKVRTGNIQKTNFIEKGISTLLLESQFENAIKKYYSNIKFDLILYSTPPITLLGAIEYVKKRDNARTYLLLKDIFPQNAVDLELIRKNGLIHRYFRNKEKKLYAISDKIGCMSPANVRYILEHNPELDKNKVHVNPNSVEPRDLSLTFEEKNKVRELYNLPKDKKIFVYGGNLGRPQGVKFIVECLESVKDNNDVHFLIIGDGTDRHYLAEYINEDKPKNVTLINYLPKDEYDKLVAASDVGMIFLDYRFTIPNFPSRLIDYMECKLPVVTFTDRNTDVGDVVVNGKFGYKGYSDNINEFKEVTSKSYNFGNNSYIYLLENNDAINSYLRIQ